ncbi:M57 family metalloprotease [Aquimarina brevivitae]|uniref:Dual-action HEIGH metallo-peptidase n=1 Tax=Aquimarina brevivitae TaxID=323412 RepID=A0A4Q7P2R4_9FLAO|nr:M57 family metalloprotease [Aquimarina brevivitae]RZS93638.1 dual-action HEIGH metallo-peptidase [Aquimarina brevivitae]
MKKLSVLTALIVVLSASLVSCEKDKEETPTLQEVPVEILNKLEQAGFNVTDQPPIAYEEGYIVEGDIFIPEKDILNTTIGKSLDLQSKQYSTDNLVATNGSRTITVYARQGGFFGFNSATSQGIDLAIQRYNAENLELNFQRISSSSAADIRITRLNFFLEFFGVLGSAGFPTASGDPFDQIQLSGRLTNSGFDVNGIATIVAHEMGHCIGFRHTDYFDRSVSCGGATQNEGDGGVGANQIPGTPAGASVEDGSWMLACSDGGDRPFNEDDVTALNFLY